MLTSILRALIKNLVKKSCQNINCFFFFSHKHFFLTGFLTSILRTLVSRTHENIIKLAFFFSSTIFFYCLILWLSDLRYLCCRLNSFLAWTHQLHVNSLILILEKFSNFLLVFYGQISLEGSKHLCDTSHTTNIKNK